MASSLQLSSSHKSPAARKASEIQRDSSGGKTASSRKAVSAALRIGAAAASPLIGSVASPCRRRSLGRGGRRGAGPASAALLTSITSAPRASRPANQAASSASR